VDAYIFQWNYIGCITGDILAQTPIRALIFTCSFIGTCGSVEPVSVRRHRPGFVISNSQGNPKVLTPAKLAAVYL
jgi:hypothetical protein